jgi:hypothetical protein
MDDEFIYAELKNISSKQSSIESMVIGLKENMDKICDWKDDVLPTLQTCKNYMEERKELPNKIISLEKKEESLEAVVEHNEELNSSSRKDTKFLMNWFFKISGALGLLIIINIILSIIKNFYDIRGSV